MESIILISIILFSIIVMIIINYFFLRNDFRKLTFSNVIIQLLAMIVWIGIRGKRVRPYYFYSFSVHWNIFDH